MLKRIVVPLDGSECAAHAFNYALGLAKAQGATLDVMAVIDPVAILGRTPSRPHEEKQIAEARADADRALKSAVETAANAGIPAERHVELGDPVDKIVEHATKKRAQAIVMGTHGRSGFKRLFMGSVAEAVLRLSPCPVVVVREEASVETNEPTLPKFDRNAPVVVMRLVEVVPEDFERLYGEIATFMEGSGSELAGVVETEILGSEDSRRIAIVAHFRSHEDWVHAQWDSRLGELLEEIATNSKTLEFNLYRSDRFPAKVPAYGNS